MMTERKLKIAISIWSFTPNTGGLQAHAQCLCKHLMARGHEVVVVTRSATKVPVGADYLFCNEHVDSLEIDGIPVRTIRLSPVWRPLLWLILKLAARPRYVGIAARLYKLVSTGPTRRALEGFDIVHHVGHTKSLAGFAEASAAKFHNTPFLVQPTAHPFHFGDTPLDFQLYHQACRLLVHTKYERDFFLTRGITAPIDIVWNGIEDRTDGSGNRFRMKYGIKGPMFLYIGRKEADKGYPLVIEAFSQLRLQFPDITLVCMGPRSHEDDIENWPGVLELDFADEQEKHDALAACTCLCVPSSGESFGLVFMEAGLYRKPVIARNIPVLQELLGHEAAILPGAPDASRNTASLTMLELMAAMTKVLLSEEKCHDLGERCYQRASKYVWPKIVDNFENAYISAISAKAKEVRS